MNPRRLLSAAAAAAASVPAAAAFSDAAMKTRPPPRPTALRYRNYHASYYESVDVDGDRMSLLSLLDPSSPPLDTDITAPASPSDATSPPAMAATAATATTASGSGRSARRRAAGRISPVTQLRTVQDYHRHVLSDPGTVCVVRFSAPWCQTCKLTNVAWERMASRLQKSSRGGQVTRNEVAGDGGGGGRMEGGGIKFLSVVLDGRDPSTAALRDMLRISKVPQGIVHHPAGGVFGRRVDLGRRDLSRLRRRLEGYLEGGDSAAGEGPIG